MKTSISRFHIHDDLTAPDASAPLLKSVVASGGQLPNFLGVLAGSTAALRGFIRFRAELRNGKLDLATKERISLAVAEYYQSAPGLAIHKRTARQAGLGIDEVTAALQWQSSDDRQAALLTYLHSVVEGRAKVPLHLHEEARERGWTDEELLEAMAFLACESFVAMINVAGDVPVDGSFEERRILQAA